MIKITRFFYIHIATLPLFVVAYFVQALDTMLMAYCVVAVHELCHLFMALLLHIRVGSIIVMPFGITLRLQNGYIRQPYKEILVSLAGPLSNLVMAQVGVLLRTCYPWAEQSLFLFIGLNYAVMAVNLLPVLPLDGGRILKATLTHFWGFLNAFNFLRRFTRVLSVLLLVLGAVLLVVTRMNATLLLIAGFLLFNIVEEGKHNELVLMREILYSKDKLAKRGIMVSRTISAMEHVSARRLIRMFSYNNFYIIHVIGPDLKEAGTLTEAQVVAAIIASHSNATLGDILHMQAGT